MTAINKLLDKYKETCSIASDNALGECLGIRRQAVHQWRKGQSWPSDEHIVELASKTNQDPAAWMAAIHAERVTGKARAAWMKAAQRLGYAAAVIIIFSALMPTTVHAATLHGAEHFASDNAVVCILCQISNVPSERSPRPFLPFPNVWIKARLGTASIQPTPLASVEYAPARLPEHPWPFRYRNEPGLAASNHR